MTKAAVLRLLSFVSSHYLPPEEDLDDLDSLDLEEDELLLRDELLLPWFEERVVVAWLSRMNCCSGLRWHHCSGWWNGWLFCWLPAPSGVALAGGAAGRELAFPLVADELRVVEEEPLVVWFVVLADLRRRCFADCCLPVHMR